MNPYARLAGVSVACTACLGLVGWVLVPEKAWAWALVIAFPPLLWAFLEFANDGATEASEAIRRLHRIAIVALCVLLVLDVGPDLAVTAGVLDADTDPVMRRAKGFLVGAFFAAWGNHLPKVMSPWSLAVEPFDWQGVHRFVGRTCTVAGIALMIVWARLPLATADRAATTIVAAAVLLGVGTKFLSVARYSFRGRSAVR